MKEKYSHVILKTWYWNWDIKLMKDTIEQVGGIYESNKQGEDLDIFVENDGKGRWQSFTAKVDLKIPHIFDSEIEAYGDSEKEAKDNLINMVEDIIHSVSNINKTRGAVKNESK